MRRWPIVLLGLFLALAYVAVPDRFGLHGSYVKARLAFLPALLWLACSRLPGWRVARWGLVGAIAALVAVNLGLVWRYFEVHNRELEEFTAGIEQVGRNRTLRAVVPAGDPGLPDPLLHAAGYYCLTTGNIDLDNYEASLPYFPVRWRPEFLAGDSRFPTPVLPEPEVLIVFAREGGSPGPAPVSYQAIFRRGRQAIYERHVAPQH